MPFLRPTLFEAHVAGNLHTDHGHGIWGRWEHTDSCEFRRAGVGINYILANPDGNGAIDSETFPYDGAVPGLPHTDSRSVVGFLNPSAPRAAAAAHVFGYATHTIQDFYAHSNWFETFDRAGVPSEQIPIYEPSVDLWGAVIATALPVSSLTRNIAWGLVATIGLLVILNGLGLSITPMLTALGVGGLAVALAMKEPLANFFAGVFLTLGGQIRLGDYVKLDSGQEGYVADFSWRSTRLRMLPNNLVIVPNAKLAQAIVVNHHLPSQDLAVLVEVGVDYTSDLTHVEHVVTDVGRAVMTEVPGGIAGFEPFIRYHTFADSSVNFTVILRAAEFVDQYVIKHEFIKRLHARFAREGIVIPFPIRTIVQREEPAGALPADMVGV